MKDKIPIVIVVCLIFLFCIVNMALGDTKIPKSLDGGIIDVEELHEQSAVQKAPKYIRSTHSQKRVKVHMVTAPEDATIIKTGTSLGDIVEVTKLPENALCNILLVAPEALDTEKNKKLPVVSNKELNKLWCVEGNSCPVKLSGVKHPLPKYYWNVLLSGEACRMIADEEDFYLASDFKQLTNLPQNIKKAIIKVKVIMTEEVDGKMKDVEKTFFWGDPEIANAKNVLFMMFNHNWAGADNTFNLIDPALLKYRKTHK